MRFALEVNAFYSMCKDILLNSVLNHTVDVSGLISFGYTAKYDLCGNYSPSGPRFLDPDPDPTD